MSTPPPRRPVLQAAETPAVGPRFPPGVPLPSQLSSNGTVGRASAGGVQQQRRQQGAMAATGGGASPGGLGVGAGGAAGVEAEEEGGGSERYCLCRTSDVSGTMLECDFCQEWFHVSRLLLLRLGSPRTRRWRRAGGGWDSGWEFLRIVLLVGDAACWSRGLVCLDSSCACGGWIRASVELALSCVRACVFLL